MPVLDAKALESDPAGVAFLRSVIRPGFAREAAVAPPPGKDPQRSEAAAQVPMKAPRGPLRSVTKPAVTVT